MQNVLDDVYTSATEGNNWEKLVYPTVGLGKTAFPRKPADQERLGVRLDYQGEITIDGIVYYVYEMQPNGGHGIPSSIKRWRGANGGTHAVMTNVYVKKGGTKQDVQHALNIARRNIRGV